MISRLPNSLISEILSHLPTKEAVRTSVLSNRWKKLWLLIPGLDLHSYEFSNYNAFASFIHRCLDFSREKKSCLHKLKLSIHQSEKKNCVTRWINFVATRKLKHLDVEFLVKRKCLEVMPISLFICETLLSLRLRQVLFGSSFEDSSSVSLPRLKTMRLELNIYANETSLESLISSCPVLEDLSIVRRFDDNVKVLRVRSQTLTSLSIKYYCGRGDNEEVNIRVADDFELKQLRVLIDAPKLKDLSFEDEISASKTISNSSSLTKVNILGTFYLDSDDQIRKFFTSFSGVRVLKISCMCLQYIKDVVTFHQFWNLSCLETELTLIYMENLLMLLTSCPNLRSLILHFMNSSVNGQMRLLYVPMCLLSSLEFVEIKGDLRRDPVVKLARYFTENSVILKKLVLRLKRVDPAVFGDLLALRRRSSICHIFCEL